MQAKRSIFAAEDLDQIGCGDERKLQERQVKGPSVEAVLRCVIGTEQGIESFGPLGR